MRKRAVLGSVVASSAVLAISWQLGNQAATGFSASAPIANTQNVGASNPTPRPAGTPTPTPRPTASATPTATPSASPSTQAQPTSTPTPAPAVAAPAPAAPAPVGVSGTFTGSAVQTRYGTVQVSITVGDGAITDVTALKLTDADKKSVQISSRAAPVLRSEVLAAQSATVDTVSGATYTSEGYLSSLQSALDQAGL